MVELDLLQDRRRPGTLHLAELAAEEMFAEHRQREADEAALGWATAAEQQQQQPSASQAVPPAHGAAGAAHSGTVPDAVDEVSWSAVRSQRPVIAFRCQMGLTSGQLSNGSVALSASTSTPASCSSPKMAAQPGV